MKDCPPKISQLSPKRRFSANCSFFSQPWASPLIYQPPRGVFLPSIYQVLSVIICVLETLIWSYNRLFWNIQFYICLLSCLALEWKYGCGWPCFDKNLPAFLTDGVLMIISRNLHEKNSEVSIKTRSTPGLLSFKGQATKHTTILRP